MDPWVPQEAPSHGIPALIDPWVHQGAQDPGSNGLLGSIGFPRNPLPWDPRFFRSLGSLEVPGGWANEGSIGG